MHARCTADESTTGSISSSLQKQIEIGIFIAAKNLMLTTFVQCINKKFSPNKPFCKEQICFCSSRIHLYYFSNKRT